ncbi:hypothetical protein conserved [Leishmania donovani]|uniref:Uncharacterized protein n=3 Tax=Leishmania donovani species complex TaxID=38574 RepID=A4HSA8_LEIIN|nr:conserved hypothetical protein [Leishmania infantum JPCM5]XP_003858173.1 hypothetical protein, conserved [Leishmania donovani]CAC9442137.1 hypothetical_protein_-_conserved [Leishmania infantum]AYU75891.1 hypothetical protein LdCL_040016700 [Leishmania donovani]TPP43044.1 hypothetical protein CGC20_9565 [Leishmania donovani]TPP51526.1 hypothetical protein CGC21_2970 [Leishmania donovani]CAJ1985956.1 hypothetical protein conserved [Leishmania donovani]|eukprot:XP_001462950.1 conserved hypothetical protein [Leishmania infantum JPCM5]
MSRSRQQQAEEVALHHFFKTERVIRLECERREAKARLKLIDIMSGDLDDQLLCVAQFKKEWLQSRRVLEEARQAVVQEEASKRAYVEEEYVRAINKMIRHYHPLSSRAV